MAGTFDDARLTYGITPPKIAYSEEKRLQTAALQSARIAALPIDALVVYDLQDESSRTDAKRPFPFLRAIDPLSYAYEYLSGVPQKKIVYRSVSTLTREELVGWLRRLDELGGAAVLVGAPSRSESVKLRLPDAYRVRLDEAAGVPLGGVVIAERHESRGGEDERVLRKLDQGCSFFISQAVYSVTASKNLLSSLHYRCQEAGRPVPPISLTLSPCGSKKTLEFMSWLGVSVPLWLRNELLHAHDILEKSVDLSLAGFEELLDFAREKRIPLGCNVESVSLRKEEIEASVHLVHRVARILGRG
ncbi:MAG: hypothetical protein R3B89_32460 [Polyangiaceae bacterium]